MRMQQCYLRIALRVRSASGLLDALGLGYDLPVGQAVYAIDAFPDDDLLWRIEWIGGVGYPESGAHDGFARRPWSVRTMASETGLSKSSVQRIWSAHGLQPHRVRDFKLSKDLQFEEKFWDV